jgi:hypothetical protein
MPASSKAPASGAKATDRVKPYVNKCVSHPWWEYDISRHRGDRIPDAARRWRFSASKGGFRELTIEYDKSSGQTQIITDRGNDPVLTIDHLKAAWEYGKEHGGTVVEAFLATYGEDNLSRAWVEEARRNDHVEFKIGG